MMSSEIDSANLVIAELRQRLANTLRDRDMLRRDLSNCQCAQFQAERDAARAELAENWEKATAEIHRAGNDLSHCQRDLHAERERVRVLREALVMFGRERQFAGRLCFCTTVAGLYCVGQEKCEKARAALTLGEQEQK